MASLWVWRDHNPFLVSVPAMLPYRAVHAAAHAMPREPRGPRLWLRSLLPATVGVVLLVGPMVLQPGDEGSMVRALTISACLLPLCAALLTLGIWAGETRTALLATTEDVKELRSDLKGLQQSQLSWIRSIIDEEKSK